MRADAADLAGGHAAFVFLLVDVPVAADFDLAPLGEEVDHRHAHAVQTAGGLVGPLLELAAELEHGHHAFERGDLAAHLLRQLVVAFDGDAAAVVLDGDRAVVVDRDADVLGEAGHGLVDRVVDDFVDQVVQAAGRGVADVHAGRSRTCSRSLRCCRSSEVYSSSPFCSTKCCSGTAAGWAPVA